MDSEENYSLILKNNYLSDCNYNTTEATLNYFNVIKELIFHYNENIIRNNHDMFIFGLKRGSNIIKHIFNFLLLYTNNLDLTVYHTKKSYLYYVEFISQIGNDQHSYLQLSSKDASLFILKKTIFKIDIDVKNDLDCSKNSNINKLIYLISNIINTIFFTTINNKNMKDSTRTSFLMYLFKMTDKLVKKIVSCDNFENDLDDSIIKYSLFLNIITTNSISCIDDEGKYFNILNLLLKKLSLKNENIKKNIKKNLKKNIDEKVNSLTPIKFVNWLIN